MTIRIVSASMSSRAAAMHGHDLGTRCHRDPRAGGRGGNQKRLRREAFVQRTRSHCLGSGGSLDMRLTAAVSNDHLGRTHRSTAPFRLREAQRDAEPDIVEADGGDLFEPAGGAAHGAVMVPGTAAEDFLFALFGAVRVGHLAFRVVAGKVVDPLVEIAEDVAKPPRVRPASGRHGAARRFFLGMPGAASFAWSTRGPDIRRCCSRRRRQCRGAPEHCSPPGRSCLRRKWRSSCRLGRRIPTAPRSARAYIASAGRRFAARSFSVSFRQNSTASSQLT